MKQKIRNENSGFTLVELVITIAVLAVISVPLLMYFTDSMRHSAQMKEQQNAVVAAQNVLEELKVLDMSLDNQDQLTMAVTPPPGATPFPVTSVTWEPVPVSTASPGPTDSYEVKGNYKLNNQSYLVKAKITPRKQLENDAGDTVTYRKAKAPGMDSSKDMIITETASTLEDAKLYFYGEHTQYCDANNMSRNPAVKVDVMGKCLQRKIYINAKPDVESGNHTGKIILTARFEYQWNASGAVISVPAGITAPGAGVTNPTTYTKDVKVALLDGTGSHNIFLFYTPIHYAGSSGTVVVSDEVILSGKLIKVTNASSKVIVGNAGTGKDDLQYRLYLVADGTVDRSHTVGYTTKLSDTSSSGDNFGTYISDVYTNLTGSSELNNTGYAINTVFPSATSTDHGFHYKTLLENPEINRVAEIEVSVYKDKGDGNINEKNLYTTVNGTKVQSQ